MIGEELAVEAMKAGAHDYIMKGNLTRLVPAIERELREAEGRQTAAANGGSAPKRKRPVRSIFGYCRGGDCGQRPKRDRYPDKP